MTSRAQAMSIGRFRNLAEIWGGDIARWPEAERAAAAQLAARAPEAAAALAEAAARGGARRPARWPVAAMMAAAAIFGLAIGLSGALDAALAPPREESAALVSEDLLAAPDALAALFGEAT